jgi:predicted amidophosphoribosyltransferase
MEALCKHCGAYVSAAWKFCPQCATAVEPTKNTTPVNPPAVQPAAGERAPAKGAFAGLFFGMVAVPLLLVVGSMLCLTGLGAFVGIPMIVAGICAPLIGPLLGVGALHGVCPWCGARIGAIGGITGFYCHVCSKRIAIEGRKFRRVGS